MNNWAKLGIAILICGMLGGAGYYGFRSGQPPVEQIESAPQTVAVETCDVQQTVTAPGKLVNTHEVTLEMPAAGQLETISVRPGERVSAGQALAEVSDREQFAAAVTAAELALRQAEAELEDLHAGAPAQAAEAQLALAEAEERLEQAEKERARMNYPRYRDDLVVERAEVEYKLAKQKVKKAQLLYNKYAHRSDTDLTRAAALRDLLAAKQAMDLAFATYNWYLLMPPENEVAQAEAELALAQAELEQAQMRWELLREGPEPLDLALAEAKIADARAQLEAALATLEDLTLRAPFDGIVLAVNANPGEQIAEGAGVIVLVDPLALEVETTVVEEDLPYVQVGQAAELFFDALPEAELSGKVARVLPVRTAGERPLYTVYISLDEVPQELVDGMTADASLVIAAAEGVLCLPRSLARTAADGSAQVEVWNGAGRERRSIQVGLRGDTNVEILSGLQAGDLVVSR